MWKYLISFCFIVPAWHMKVASKSWLSTNYKNTKWNPLTGIISVNTWISRRPLIWTVKMLEAALMEGRFSMLQPTKTSQIQWLIHVSMMEIHQVLWGSRSLFIHLQTHILKHKHPSFLCQQPWPQTRRQKTRFTVSRGPTGHLVCTAIKHSGEVVKTKLMW